MTFRGERAVRRCLSHPKLQPRGGGLVGGGESESRVPRWRWHLRMRVESPARPEPLQSGWKEPNVPRRAPGRSAGSPHHAAPEPRRRLAARDTPVCAVLRDVARRPALRPAAPRGRGRGRAQVRVRSSSGVTQAPCSLPLPLASVATLPGASVTGLKLVAERTKPREPRQAERPNHPRPPDTGGKQVLPFPLLPLLSLSLESSPRSSAGCCILINFVIPKLHFCHLPVHSITR